MTFHSERKRQDRCLRVWQLCTGKLKVRRQRGRRIGHARQYSNLTVCSADTGCGGVGLELSTKLEWMRDVRCDTIHMYTTSNVVEVSHPLFRRSSEELINDECVLVWTRQQFSDSRKKFYVGGCHNLPSISSWWCKEFISSFSSLAT